MRFVLCALALTALSLSGVQRAHAATKTSHLYDLDYEFTFEAGRNTVDIAIRLGRNADLMRWMRFRIDPGIHSGFSGDGEITDEGRVLLWTPPRRGGELRYRARIDHRRLNGAFDALHGKDWALLRGDDLVPAARVRTAEGAESRARLAVRVPRGWSVETPYAKASDGRYIVSPADRRFDRPTGWMIVGKLGVRREKIAGTQVSVAAPVGHGVRRMDTLAFLNWNLPVLARIAPRMPGRLLIVGAADPMWRGGLSGPASLYIHADRPLISENGTSTLMHEVIHSVLRLSAAPGNDWIVEGLAEYYSLEIMRRSGTISTARFTRAHDALKKWGRKTESLETSRSKGAVTARAVGVLARVDGELRRGPNDASLDDVVEKLVRLDAPVSLAAIRRIAGELNGGPVIALSDDRLPGMQK